MDTDKILLFFRKRIEPFIALGVIIMLIFIATQLYHGNNLRTEISQNCGWEGKDYRCFCEKEEAMAIKAKMDNNFTLNLGDIQNVQVDR